MEDIFSKSTVNEMERAISDLKSENLRLKLDLGIKHDRDTTSVDESLRSVDEEVQEVTAVRLVLKKILVDNDTIKIKGKARTRGSLLDFDVNYTIKPIDFSYTPEVITKMPKLSARLGVEGGIPTISNTNFLLKGNLSLENSKGNGLNLGYDTQNRIWVGFSKTFKIIK